MRKWHYAPWFLVSFSCSSCWGQRSNKSIFVKRLTWSTPSEDIWQRCSSWCAVWLLTYIVRTSEYYHLFVWRLMSLVCLDMGISFSQTDEAWEQNNENLSLFCIYFFLSHSLLSLQFCYWKPLQWDTRVSVILERSSYCLTSFDTNLDWKSTVWWEDGRKQ